MQVNDIKEWKNRPWTHLYEAALFERNTVKLCERLWDAQLAILSREKEIDSNSGVHVREQLALRKAKSILCDLRRLCGIDQDNDHIRHRRRNQSMPSHSRNPRIRLTARVSKQVSS
jgi:hypothetical protein